MGSELVHKQAYNYLLGHAKAATRFTYAEIAAAVTSWKKQSTWTTYVSKQLRGYVDRHGDQWSVKATFAQLSFDDYRGGATQVRIPVPKWNRRTYDQVVSYEFLLPLTREDKLRAALDKLFYREELEKRTREFQEAELAELGEVIAPMPRESEDAYRDRVIDQVAALIGGYSISHVNGRFRATDNVVSRTAAARMLVEQQRYLIDETTAVVRFIVRCPNSKVDHGERFDHRTRGDRTRLQQDVRLIRTLFFHYFVEAVAGTIQGEDVIWLMENSPTEGLVNYAFEKVAPENGGGDGNDVGVLTPSQDNDAEEVDGEETF